MDVRIISNVLLSNNCDFFFKIGVVLMDYDLLSYIN